MVIPVRGGSSYSSLMVLLLIGLSALAWISTYSGMLQLIAASSGEIGMGAKVALGFAVLMLQGMIIYILDALFSGQLRFALYPFYIIGYAALVLISVAFAFGFYWRFLESGAQTTQAAGVSVSEVQRALQTGQSRLELLQNTFTALSTISSQKASTERASGGTCPNSRAGEGPRRRLRETDAQRFQFANDLIATRTNAVKGDIADLNGDLQRVLKKDPSTLDPETGTRTPFIEGLDRKLGLVVTRFNSLRADPQLREIRDELATRARQTSFPDDRGGTFACPDGQIQTALNGVVRSIDDLPNLQKPELRSVEGSEAVIEAFRRLSNSGIGFVTGEEKGGLSDRDYIPLMIAIFVDVCILLVSVNRPFGAFFNLGQDLSRAKSRGPMQGVLETFYQVFQDQFHGEVPSPGRLIAPIQDVVFDYKGDYYAAVPLDFREENYDEWAGNRKNVPSFESAKALERSRYLAAVFAILEGEKLVQLIGDEKNRFGRGGAVSGLDEETVRGKLDKQGSMYAQADAFRIYRFRPGKWAALLIETVGSAAAREDSERKRRNGSGEVFAGFLKSRQTQRRFSEPAHDDLDRIEEEARPRLPDRSHSE